MINRSGRFLYQPSLVWVGVGPMSPERTRFPLQPVYDRFHVRLVQGEAKRVHPNDGYVVVEPTGGDAQTQVDLDYLIVATGAHLNFAGTPGLGPKEGTTCSICTMEHAAQTRDQYLATVKRMARGERQRTSSAPAIQGQRARVRPLSTVAICGLELSHPQEGSDPQQAGLRSGASAVADHGLGLDRGEPAVVYSPPESQSN